MSPRQHRYRPRRFPNPATRRTVQATGKGNVRNARQLFVRVDDDIFEDVRKLAIRRRRSLAAIAKEAIEAGLYGRSTDG